MPRAARIAPGGRIFHALNRANGGGRLFDSPACYREFLRIVGEVAVIDSMRILAYCAMPNHWHLLLWPRGDGDLARFMHRVSLRHTQRWHLSRQTTGRGHLYQGRYKSFAVSSDRHLLVVCRYIERNPLRAGLVPHAEQWPWSSAATHMLAEGCGGGDGRSQAPPAWELPLTALPVDAPSDWGRFLHEPQNQTELDAMRFCLRRGTPYGDASWQAEAARRLGLALEPGKAGRPAKGEANGTDREASGAGTARS